MRALLAVFLCLFSAPVLAAETITFERASVIESPAGIPTAGVSVVISNNGADDKIVSARSPAATNVYLNTTAVSGNGAIVASKTDFIAVPGGKTTTLNVAGDYINLSGIVRALKAGDKISLQITFERAGEKTIDVDVVSGADYSKRFPPEMLGPNLEKSRVAHENAKAQETPAGSFGERLRNKLRALSGEAPKKLPAPQPAATPAPPRVKEGPVSVPGSPMPAPEAPAQ